MQENEKALTSLRRLGTLLQCPARVAFCQQGAPSDQVFLIERGLVVVTIASPGGNEYWVGLRQNGWLLGASSAITAQPCATRLVAQTQSAVRVIPTTDFLALLTADAGVSRYVHDLHARELSEQLSGLANLALCNARYRLEDFLWRILPTLPAVQGKVQLPLSDVEITKVICCTPQYLSLIFKQLESEGVLRRSGGWVSVPDPNRLRHRQETTF
jgi:CRP-like cAMP-binding protein